MEVFYFSYGINMSTKIIEARELRFKFVAKGMLKGHKITFHRYSSEWNGITASLEISYHDNAEGIIFSTDMDTIERLDLFEGVERDDMVRKEVEVISTTPTVCSYKCYTYIRIPKDPDVGNFSINYLKLLLESYRNYSFSVDLIKRVEDKLSRTFIVDRTQKRKRTATKGKYLIQIDRGSLRSLGLKEGQDVVVGYKKQYSPARIHILQDTQRDERICRLDKSIRNVLGLDDLTLRRDTVTIYPVTFEKIKDRTFGEILLNAILFPLAIIFIMWPPYLLIKNFIYPRTFLLKVQRLKSDIVEKNVAVVPKQYLKLIGLDEGKFVDIEVPVYKDDLFVLRKLTIRAFSDENIEKEDQLKSQRIYLDGTTRDLLGVPYGIPDEDFPFAEITPNIDALLAERSIIYLATILFLVGRFQTLLFNFGRPDTLFDFWLSVVLSVWFIGLVVYFELKNKIRY